MEDRLRALLDNSDIEEKLRLLMDLPGIHVNHEQETMEIIHDLLRVAPGDDKEHRREIFKKIVTAVLSYYIIPSSLPISELSRNNTWATRLSLNDGSLDGEALRLRIAPSPGRLIPLTLSVNVFSNIIKPNTFTSNGG